MSSFPLIDSHVHLWDLERQPHPWVAEFSVLNQNYGTGRFNEERGDIDVDNIIFVECTGLADNAAACDEVRWVQELAKQEPRLQGIVAHASLEQGDDAVQTHLQWLSRRPLVRGVRRLLQDEAPTFCLQPAFIDGVHLLAEFDFTFDICIYHYQLPQIIELVERCPDVQFVLDHMGKPAIRERSMEPWRRHIRALANCPNVVCKISGALTEARIGEDDTDAVRPYVDYVMQTFGCDRLMFGGDWPVLKRAGTYAQWARFVQEVAGGLAVSEQRQLFRDTAERVYWL